MVTRSYWSVTSYIKLKTSFWAGDIIWHHRPLSSLVQVMACCPTAPSHYLNQCWHTVNWTLWNKLRWNFNQNIMIFILKKTAWKYCLQILVRLVRVLTHWGQLKHISVSKLTIIDSDNGLSPGRCQAIIWTNAGILIIRTLATNFREILSEI